MIWLISYYTMILQQITLTFYIIFLSLPVTEATAERFFSKLKIIKNHFRNSFGQKSESIFKHCYTQYIEKDRTSELKIYQ